MPDVVVRLARRAELAAVGELRIAAYRAQNLLSAHPAYADTLRILGADGRGEVLVAVDGDVAVTEAGAEAGAEAGVGAEAGEEILGSIMLDPWHEGSEIARGPDEAEIRGLAVAPAAQGRGVGTRLVRAVIARAAAGGTRRLLLSTQPAMAAAQRLYVATGFSRLPERDWSPTPGLTLLAFCLPLAD
jgi:ribosomal protein S18 acetylase RimI-like enzyme